MCETIDRLTGTGNRVHDALFIRIAHRDCDDEAFRFRDASVSLHHIRIHDALVMDAGIESEMQRSKTDVLHDGTHIKHRSCFSQCLVDEDDDGSGGIEVAETSLHPHSPFHLVFPGNVHDLKDMLGEIHLSYPIDAVVRPSYNVAGCGISPALSFSALPSRILRRGSPATTTNSHGWVFMADGARMAISKISLITAFGMGSGL